MNISEKKADIINALQQNNNEDLINEVYALLHTDQSIESIITDELPLDLKNKLVKAIEDYRSGRYITHEQMQQKVTQWLTR